MRAPSLRRDRVSVTAATAAIAGGILVVADLVASAAGVLPRHDLRLLSLLSLADLLVALAVIGIWRIGAAGDGALARSGLALSVLGLLLDAPGEVLTEAARPIATALSSAGTIAAALGFVLLGSAVLRTRRWTGWHRFVVLALGLYVPLILFPALALKQGADVAFALLGVWYVLVGVAIWSELSAAHISEASPIG